jgi:4-amino-4-deoxy-L-arabinose transferase-like glycosyltransferase
LWFKKGEKKIFNNNGNIYSYFLGGEMKRKLVVLTIFLLTLATRLVVVDKTPPHLSNDEISIAYDAYSIAFSGKDEHNHAWPLSFQSHGTYKAPLYAYVLAPFEKVFGNSELVARIPSLAAGILTVGIVGLIAFELTGSFWVGVAVSGVLAVTPGHIMSSRMVLESNLALVFLSLGIYLILKKQWGWGVLALVVSMYGYHTEWGLVPILILLIIKTFIKSKKLAIILILAITILAAPLAIDYVKNSGPGARAKSEMLWKDAALEVELKQDNSLVTGIKIIGIFSENYLGYFSPSYWFFNGLELIPKNNPFQPGIFLWPLLIPMIIGIAKIKTYIKGEKLKFFIGWLLISPIVAALTHGGPNLIRNLNSLLPLSIIIGIGLTAIAKKYLWPLLVVTGISLATFMIIYLVIYPVEMAESFEGYKPIVEFSKTIEEKARNIFIDYRYGDYANGHGVEYIGVPHLYFGYYGKWNPAIIQNRIEEKDGTNFGKYVVGKIDWNNLELNSDDYYVVPIGNLPTAKVVGKISQVAVFNDASGKKAFEMWKGK